KHVFGGRIIIAFAQPILADLDFVGEEYLVLGGDKDVVTIAAAVDGVAIDGDAPRIIQNADGVDHTTEDGVIANGDIFDVAKIFTIHTDDPVPFCDAFGFQVQPGDDVV